MAEPGIVGNIDQQVATLARIVSCNFRKNRLKTNEDADFAFFERERLEGSG